MPLILLLALTRQGTLVIETPNYGATISVDRRPIGTAPVEPHTVAVGWHLVEVFARGRPPWARLVFVPPGRTVTLEARLAALPRRARRRRREPKAVPVWALTGRVGVRSARRGPDRGTALEHRARLKGTDVLGANTRLRVEIGGDSRLHSAGRPLVRLLEPEQRTRLRIDAAWAAWRGVRAGRIPLTGPADMLLTLDGVDASATWRGWRLVGRGGARGAPVGARDADPVAGLALSRRDAVFRTQVAWWHHADHHLDARLGARGVRWDTAAAVTTIGRRLHRVTGDARWDHVRLGYAVRGPATSRLVDPLRSLRLDPLDRVPWHGPRIVIDAGSDTWAGSGSARLRMSRQGARFDAQGGVEHRASPWRPGLWIDGVATEWTRAPEEPALRQRVGLRASVRRSRVELSAGGAWQVTDASQALLPEGAVRFRLPLVNPLELYLDAGASAVDPAVLTGRGLLLHGRLGVRLR